MSDISSFVGFTIILTNPNLEPDELEQETVRIFSRLRELYKEDIDEDVNKIKRISKPESTENKQGKNKKGGGLLPGKIKGEVEIDNLKRLLKYIEKQITGQYKKIEFSINGQIIKLEGEFTQEELKERLEQIGEIMEAAKRNL